ncbi:MAG: FecR family protein [Acidobacteriota bacterium]|nr:FecR family protein [Acidobacteriota bacterium]
MIFGIGLLVSGSTLSADAASESHQFGVLVNARGVVSIQGSPVSPGATLMPRDVITTGSHSAASFSLPRYGLTVLPGTQVSLLPGTVVEGIKLHHGAVVLREQSTSPVRVEVPGAWIVVRGESLVGALGEISSLGTSSKVAVERGIAEIYGAGAPVVLHSGQWARLEAGGGAYDPQPQGRMPAAGRAAGKVSRQIPRGRLDRRGQNLPLVLSDAIEWDDEVHTLDSGRLQITLSDGSILSVGSHSNMKIVKHDEEAQQTQLELAVARLRADVQKISKTGGRFEVRTKTAVIGVVGTSFVVDADETRTRVCVIDGDVEVRSSDPAVPQTSVRVHTGDCVTVRRGAPPGSPVSAPSQIARLVSQTNVGTTASSSGVAASGTAASAHASTALIVTVVTVGALGGTLGGLAAVGEFTDRTPVSVAR